MYNPLSPNLNKNLLLLILTLMVSAISIQVVGCSSELSVEPRQAPSGGTTPILEQEIPQKQFESQIQEIPFDQLKIEAVENQKLGHTRTEDAIPAQERVFSDAESWYAFWAQHDIQEFPEVDFATNWVVAVFLSAKGDGYDVRIQSITYDLQSELITVHVLETIPDPQKLHLGVVRYPADIVVFPAVRGKVDIVRKTQVED